MKFLTRSLLFSLVFPWSAFGQTFTTTDAPQPIPDGNSGGITSTINVTGGTSILDANVLVDINHTFVGDLIVRITSPGGTTVDLLNRLSADVINFGDGEDLIGSYLFDDEALNPVPTSPGVSNPPIPPGTYLPKELLSAFDGESAAGIWTLFVSDNASSDTGTLNFWQLILSLELPTPTVTPQATASSAAPVPFILVDTPALAEPGRGNAVFQTARSTTQQAALSAQQDIVQDSESLRRAIEIGGPASPPVTASTLSPAGAGSLARFLDFMGDTGVHPLVALGLAEGEEKTVSSPLSLLATQGAVGSGLPIMMLGGMGVAAASAEPVAIVVPAAEGSGGKAVVSEKAVIVDDVPSWRWRFFTGGDFNRYNQDRLTELIQPFNIDTWSGSLGGEYVVIPHHLAMGLGYSYVGSDTELGGNLGAIDSEGHVLTAFIRATWNQIYSKLYYSYGSFDNDIHRNTSWGESASGSPDSQSHNLYWKTGYVFQPTQRLLTGPYLELAYAQGSLEGYTERGSTRGNLAYEGTEYESLRSGLGWAVEYRLPTAFGDLDLQVHAAWERENLPEDGATSSQLVNSPFLLINGSQQSRIGGYGATTDGAHAGTDWLGCGVIGRLHLGQDWELAVAYEGQFFRSNASAHFVSAFVSHEF